MDFRKAKNLTHQGAVKKRNAKWWGVTFHTRGMQEDDTQKFLEQPIQAYSKSEARAILKKKLGLTRFPSRISLSEIVFGDQSFEDSRADNQANRPPR